MYSEILTNNSPPPRLPFQVFTHWLLHSWSSRLVWPWRRQVLCSEPRTCHFASRTNWTRTYIWRVFKLIRTVSMLWCYKIKNHRQTRWELSYHLCSSRNRTESMGKEPENDLSTVFPQASYLQSHWTSSPESIFDSETCQAANKLNLSELRRGDI